MEQEICVLGGEWWFSLPLGECLCLIIYSLLLGIVGNSIVSITVDVFVEGKWRK